MALMFFLGDLGYYQPLHWAIILGAGVLVLLALRFLIEKG